jgi:DNA-binding HxlR family transcriptional regulator
MNIFMPVKLSKKIMKSKDAPFCNLQQRNLPRKPKVVVPRHETYQGAPGCAIEAAFDTIGGKWKGVILYQMIHAPCGFSNFQRKLPELSHRILSRQLQELEAHGIIRRKILKGNPPRTRYSLSKLGRSLVPSLEALKIWGDKLLATDCPPMTPRLKYLEK